VWQMVVATARSLVPKWPRLSAQAVKWEHPEESVRTKVAGCGGRGGDLFCVEEGVCDIVTAKLMT
jgi:hypothetical protein